MNKLSILILLSFITISSCNNLIECEEISEKELFLLVDASDPELLKDTEAQLKGHFSGFMDKRNLGKIQECERFFLSMSPLNSQEVLDVKTIDIGIDRKGLSNNEVAKRASPKPLVQFIKGGLTHFKKLAEDSLYTSGTNIANVLLKSFIQLEPGRATTVILFSDMVENNPYMSFFETIPDSNMARNLPSKYLDPMLLKGFKEIQGSLEFELIVVMLGCPEKYMNKHRRGIVSFWNQLFQKLEIEQYGFSDNLSTVK